MSATEQVIDHDKIGKKGFPRHYQAFNLDPPMKVVPVIDDQPQADHEGLSLDEQVMIERDRRIAAGAVVSIPDYGDVPVQGGGSHDRNMQALGQVALARTGAGDITTITLFRDAQNVMHELTPPQVMHLWLGAVAATEAIYAASWALKDMADIPADYADDEYWPS